MTETHSQLTTQVHNAQLSSFQITKRSMQKFPAVFITFEGGEGVGKSTQITILNQALQELGKKVCVLREPGATALGEALRKVVLDSSFASVDSLSELFIYEACRAQMVSERLIPELMRCDVVLLDRYCDSSIAYQAFGRGLDVELVSKLNELATGGIMPDRTLLFHSQSVRESLDRAHSAHKSDRIEQASIDFHERVSKGFDWLIAKDAYRIRSIDADQTILQVSCQICAALTDIIPSLESASVYLSCASDASCRKDVQ